MTLPTHALASATWVRALALAAATCWLVSLALPGFMVDTRAQPLFGAEVLVFGLLFGWMVQGWAAYSNLFFLRAAYTLRAGRQPRASVLAMLVLALTLPLFRGVLRDEGSSTILPVVSWGWGAVLWASSLVLLSAAAAVRARWLPLVGAKAVLGLMGVGLLALGGVHLFQRAAANEQERGLYLAPGMAFTRETMCGVPLTTVSSPLLPPDTVVALDNDPALNPTAGTGPALWLPRLLNYQEAGFAWVTFADPALSSSQVQVRQPARADRPVLQTRQTAEGAVLRLLAGPSGAVLYEQPLKAVTSAGGSRHYCPMSTQLGYSGLRVGYDTHLLRALGQQPAAPARANLVAETARQPCSLGAEDQDGVQGLRSWDGRQVILQPESVRTRVGFCSDAYVVLVYVSSNAPTPLSALSPVAQVFDRKTLRPLATFNDRHVCHMGRCPEAPRDIVKGVRIADAEVVVETTVGDLVARRWLP